MQDRPARPNLDEIELTAAMIEAGAHVLYRFHTGDEPMAEFRNAAKECFRAMIAAACVGDTPAS